MVSDAKALDQQKQMSSALFYMMLIMGVMFFVLFVPGVRDLLGTIIGYPLDPTIGFDNLYPVLSIIFASMLTTIISTIVRHFMTDYIKMARDQEINKALSKELRDAQKENNLYKMKRLQEMQLEKMGGMSTGMVDQMKPQIFTIFIFIGIYTWLAVLLGDPLTSEYAAFGWSDHFGFFENAVLFPNWVLIYMIISMSLSSFLIKMLKLVTFSRKLKELGA